MKLFANSCAAILMLPSMGTGDSPMHRRTFISGVASGLLVSSVVVAQPSAKVYRIGYLGNFPLSAVPASARMWDAFTQALQQGGYVEGKNIVFEMRYAEGRNERLPALAADLVREDVDVIVVAAAGSGASAVRDATKTIPIVMVGVTDPVGTGLIASLSHPGGNITGIVDFHAELDPKRLELLKTAAPKAMRVAVIAGQFGPPSTAIDPYRSELASVAQALSVRLSYIDLNNPDAFEKATAAIMTIALDTPGASERELKHSVFIPGLFRAGGLETAATIAEQRTGTYLAIFHSEPRAQARR